MFTITNFTTRIVKQLKTWVANKGHFLLFWRSKESEETEETEESLIELPDTIKKKLANAVQNLPSNPADVEAILSQLNVTFDRWCEDPDNEYNSIVILSSPVTAVSHILSETLGEWAEEKQVSIKLVSLRARPNETTTIRSQLEHYLESESTENDSQKQQIEVVIVPNLCWCFLRSVEGLKGIEYLQSLLCERISPNKQQDRQKNRFWIFGANHIGWDYLNLVFNLRAYCGEVVTLPEIESKELEEWFNPIVEEFNISFDRSDIDKQLLEQDKSNENNYFERLSDISKKVSIVAAQVFLRSIYYREIDNQKDSESSQKILVVETPTLPDLPDLQPADQYLLYSLLLHDDLTISTLAESLGDEEAEVQGIVQILRSNGILEQNNKTLRINPIHYPRLKQQLRNNNFIINRG